MFSVIRRSITSAKVLGAAVVVLAGAGAHAQTLEWAAVTAGGGITSNGSILVVGQVVVGTMSSASFTIEVGIIAGLAAPEPCSTDDDCNDGDDCTTDTCDPGDPSAGADGCVHEFQQRLFADIVPAFCPPSCPQPDLDDILCVIDGFGAGQNWATVCPLGDLDPCGDGDNDIDLDDILKVIDAFGGNPACPDPCP